MEKNHAMSAEDIIIETLDNLMTAIERLQKRIAKLEERLTAPVQTYVHENQGMAGYGPWPWHEEDYE